MKINVDDSSFAAVALPTSLQKEQIYVENTSVNKHDNFKFRTFSFQGSVYMHSLNLWKELRNSS